MGERTGDTVVDSDDKNAVQTIDKSTVDDIRPESQGDTVITDPNSPEAVQEIDRSNLPQPPTAGELREKGYTVPDELADDDVPKRYAADQVVAATDELAVQEVEIPDLGPSDDLTPTERAANGPSEPETPSEDPAPSETTTEVDPGEVDGSVPVEETTTTRKSSRS